MVSIGALSKYDGKFTQVSISHIGNLFFVVLKISSAFSDP